MYWVLVLLVALGIVILSSLFMFYLRIDWAYIIYLRYFFFRCGTKIRYLNHGDYTYCYAERGKPCKDKLSWLFLHGFSASKDMWLPFFWNFPADIHMIAIDMPGHGNTTRKEKDDYSLEGQGDKIHQFVNLTSLGEKPFHLLGSSMGGGVAGVYTAKHPDRVAKLTLFCPLGVDTRPTLTKYLKDVQAGKKNSLLPRSEQELEALIQLINYKQTNLSNLIIKAMWKLREPNTQFYDLVFKQLSELTEMTALSENMHLIQAQTHVIWGVNDEILPSAGANILKRGILGNCTVDLVERCGHYMIGERPYYLRKLLMKPLF